MVVTAGPVRPEAFCCSRFDATAAASQGVLLWNIRFGRMVIVHTVASAFGVIDWARYGWTDAVGGEDGERVEDRARIEDAGGVEGALGGAEALLLCLGAEGERTARLRRGGRDAVRMGTGTGASRTRARARPAGGEQAARRADGREPHTGGRPTGQERATVDSIGHVPPLDPARRLPSPSACHIVFGRRPLVTEGPLERRDVPREP